MKRIIAITLIALLGLTLSYGQSKSDLEKKIVELESAIDALSTEHDSVLQVQKGYSIMYNAIKEKVLLTDFNPNDFDDIIDSLRTGRDSIFTSIMAGSESLKDTIGYLNALVDSQKIIIDKFLASPGSLSDKQINELKKIKDLLDSGILTEEEFSARKKKILKE